MPVATWLTFRPLVAIFGISLVFLSLVALYFVFKQRGRLAAIALAASMIPGGLSMMGAVGQIAPYFHSLMPRGFLIHGSMQAAIQSLKGRLPTAVASSFI